MYTKNMIREKYIDGEKVFYSDKIPELEHFFTTRSINVDDNFERVRKYLGLNKENFIHPTQTHSVNIEFSQIGKTDYPETDGVILTNKEQGVYMRFADCTPVILYDKRANVAGIVHAGWRGTVGKIAVKGAEKILNYTRSKKSDIYAVIGASIGACCYKVGQEVVDGVKSTLKDSGGVVIEKSDGVYVDLKLINSRQLIEFGVPKENIDICPFCTSCNNELFYSYRKENGTVKRHNAVIKLQ